MTARHRPPPSARDPGRFAPVFVLATARSYSSVVTAMIGQHPDLFGLPELKLFLFPSIGELELALPESWRVRGVAHRSPGLVRAVAELMVGDQSPESVAAARIWLQERCLWSGEDVFDVLMSQTDPCATVEKSPENVMTQAALDRLSSAYPRARYLHLIRHPATSQRSMQDHWRRTMPNQPFPDLEVYCVTSWLDINERVLIFGGSLPEDRYFRVRAEDLLNDPDSHLRAIARWLGVRQDDDAVATMNHPESSPFACFGPADGGVVGGNDPGFLADPVPHRPPLPQTLRPPVGETVPFALWARAATLAAELGYTDE